MATEKKETAPKTKKVIIHSNDRENNEAEMVVGLGGKIHQIKVGEEVEIAENLIGVIKNATETISESVKDSKGNLTGEIVEKKRPRYIIEAV